MPPILRTPSCACGRVVYEAAGAPIITSVCYCEDCQEGGRRIEALAGAPRVRDDDGGTPLVVYRDDRFRCVAGEDLLVAHKLKDDSPTRRMVASCCNSGMFLEVRAGALGLGLSPSLHRRPAADRDALERPSPEVRQPAARRRAGLRRFPADADLQAPRRPHRHVAGAIAPSLAR